jgi:predicted small lipoprotein YifL
MVQIIKLGHYNPIMFARFHIRLQILGRRRAVSRPHGLSALAVAVAGALCLSACGQKGPLFMPPPLKPLPTLATPPASSTAPTLPDNTTTDIPEPPEAAPNTWGNR